MKDRLLRWLRWLGNGPQEDAALLELLRESEVRMRAIEERMKALQEWIVQFDKDSSTRLTLEAEQRAELVKRITGNNEIVDKDLMEQGRALTQQEKWLESLVDLNKENAELTARACAEIAELNRRLIALETAPKSTPPVPQEEDFDPGRGWSRQKQLAEEGELQRA